MKDKRRFWQFLNRSDTEVELRIEGEIVDEDDAWLYEWLGIAHVTPNAFREELSKHKGKLSDHHRGENPVRDGSFG